MRYEVPTVDLNQYVEGSADDKKNFIQAIGKAYTEIGFVLVENHGIPQSLIDGFYQETERFFNLDESIKGNYIIPGIAGQRGYTPFGQEHAKGRSAGDLKEFWHFGQYVTDGDPIGSEYPDNVEVSECPKFTDYGKQLYNEFELRGREILAALAEFLALPKDYFDSKIHNGNSILRPIHYPPITSEPDDAVRAGEHEDINLITLLVGASAEGLQVLDRFGNWIDVTPKPNQLVVNVGDMLQRLTNGKLISTTHRVINPPREKWHTHRYSIPFFLHPRSEMDLSCLDNCISDDQPKKWDDITAGDYLNERLREIGLKN